MFALVAAAAVTADAVSKSRAKKRALATEYPVHNDKTFSRKSAKELEASSYTSHQSQDAPVELPASHRVAELPAYGDVAELPSPLSRMSTSNAPAASGTDNIKTDIPVTPRKKSTFGESFHKFSSKAGRPLNKAAHVVGSEGWWPDTGDRECLKAARILHSFTGLNENGPAASNRGGNTKEKIPAEVLENCKGLAIFTTIRAGMWSSLTGGSGVVIARRPDGSWSPPSAFLVTILGAGFVFGLDMVDCVCVLNTDEQVESFTNPRLSLGGGASVAVGPIGSGTGLGSSQSQLPIYSYVKSRGLWAGVHVDGTVMATRNDANSAFYDKRGITAKDILKGDIEWPAGGEPLIEVLKAIEGRADAKKSVVDAVATVPLPSEAAASELA